MPRPKGKKKQPTASQIAGNETIRNAKALRKMQDKLWNEMDKAPMFSREDPKLKKEDLLDDDGKPVKDKNGNSVKVNVTTDLLDDDGNPVTDKNGDIKQVNVHEVDKNGKTVMVRRTARLIGGHAYNTAASGAIIACMREMRADCERAGIPHEQESKQATPGYNVATGAQRMIEQFLSAYVQEAVVTAVRMMKDLDDKKVRLTPRLIRTAFEEVNESVFGACNPVPRSSIVCPLVKKVAKKESGGAAGDSARQPVAREE